MVPAMPGTKPDENIEHARLMLGLLESVERNGTQSQRLLAAEFGVALGLVNAYLKRCVRKGLVKVKEVPARRYAYFLTPQGFAEKSRLTLAYLGRSMTFFREARKDCGETLAFAKRLGWSRVVLAGASDLGEIAAICGLESRITVVALLDPSCAQDYFLGAPVFARADQLPMEFDGVIVTDLLAPHQTFTQAVEALGAERVLAPRLLGIPAARHEEKLAS
jgi:DNA-binding MarR family transcriptional regulator